tara:strand:+ start:179 stop:523 length:345 start_codon:yes stop_codon:yes gene_type:complete
MLTTLLVIDENVCTGLECPLTLAIVIYVLVAVLTCCCCYPGSCLCPQRQKTINPDGTEDNKGFLHRFNLLGSIGTIMENELASSDVIEADSTNMEKEENMKSNLTRRKFNSLNY